MEINKVTTIKLSEEEVRNIIAEHLKNNGYNVSANNINLVVKKKFSDDWDERFRTETLYFDSCLVSISE